MEEAKKLDWTITELMNLTRNELCELSDQLLKALGNFETSSLERAHALTSLNNIRRVMQLPNIRLRDFVHIGREQCARQARSASRYTLPWILAQGMALILIVIS
jgi:hypothetical protein